MSTSLQRSYFCTWRILLSEHMIDRTLTHLPAGYKTWRMDMQDNLRMAITAVHFTPFFQVDSHPSLPSISEPQPRGREEGICPPPCTVPASGQAHEDHARGPGPLLPGAHLQPALGSGGPVSQWHNAARWQPTASVGRRWGASQTMTLISASDTSRCMKIISSPEEISQDTDFLDGGRWWVLISCFVPFSILQKHTNFFGN